MYSNTNYIIKSEGCFSVPLSSTIGVKQGCNISPLLFNLFVNDIHEIFDQNCKPLNINNWRVNSLSFADDLVLISETENGLRNSLAALEKYCNAWGLKINPNKTKVLVFNEAFSKNLKKLSFSIDGDPIATTNSYCYLGIEVSNTGSFIKATEVLYKKALKALFSIYSSLDVRSDKINTRLFLKLFDSLIQPILLYGCDIWGSHVKNTNNAINKFILKFYRTLLGVPPNSSTAGLHCELGRFPIHVIIQQTMLRYWFRLISLPGNRLASHCYWSLVDVCPSNDPWLSTIHEIIYSSGQYYIWNGQKTFASLNHTERRKYELYMTRTLQDISVQHLSEKTKTETKLHFLENCKNKFEISSYLTRVYGRTRRSLLSKLRLGVLDLEIEIKRRNAIPREERFCKLCASQEVEDEIHFILNCPSLGQCREPFIQNIAALNPRYQSMSPHGKIKYLFFNEALPNNILEIATSLLASLAKNRKTLLN